MSKERVFTEQEKVEAMALHGVDIHRSIYAKQWFRCLSYLSNYAGGIVHRHLSKARVCFSMTAAPTACVSMLTKEIFINPLFYKEHVKSAADLGGILLHEIMHPVIDPFNKYAFKGDKGMQVNIVQDALINSILFRISPSLCGWNRRYYPQDIFPGALLRPGSQRHWNLRFNKNDADAVKNVPASIQLAQTKYYETLYPVPKKAAFLSRPSIDTLLETYFKNEKEEQEGEGKGEGEGEGKGNYPNFSSFQMSQEDIDSLTTEQIEAIEKVIKGFGEANDLPALPSDTGEENGENGKNKESDNEAGKGASKSGTLKDRWADLARREEVFYAKQNMSKEQRLRIAQEIRDGITGAYREQAFTKNKDDSVFQGMKAVDQFFVDAEVEAALLIASERDVTGEILQLLQHRVCSQTTIIPSKFTRGGLALFAAGYMPTTWKKEKRVKDEERRRTWVYLDVSGSMGNEISWVLRLIESMESRCRADIYLFSTEIVKTTAGEIRQGKYTTTGGTSFNKVLEHFVEHSGEVSNFLMVTDGHDAVDPGIIEKIHKENKNVYVLLVGASRPSKQVIESTQKWAKKVFLKKKEWWQF